MTVDYRIEDKGDYRRIHARGPHNHNISKSAEVCHECHIDVPYGTEFLEKLIDYDAHGVFHYLEGRLQNDSYNEPVRRAVVKFCPDLTGWTVLDFGAGIGQLAPFYLRRGARQVILTEVNMRLMELSRIYLQDMGFRQRCAFRLIEENDRLLCVDENSVDLIVVSEVLEHVPAQYRTSRLQVLYRKLRPGGYIIITAPNRLFPKDGHTTGLWFASWLPPIIGAWYARTFAAWRWRGWSKEDLLRQGLRGYSYFEAAKALKPLGALDVIRNHRSRPAFHTRNLKSYFFHKFAHLLFISLLHRLAPWEAWKANLQLVWRKPLRRPYVY